MAKVVSAKDWDELMELCLGIPAKASPIMKEIRALVTTKMKVVPIDPSMESIVASRGVILLVEDHEQRLYKSYLGQYMGMSTGIAGPAELVVAQALGHADRTASGSIKPMPRSLQQVVEKVNEMVEGPKIVEKAKKKPAKRKAALKPKPGTKKYRGK